MKDIAAHLGISVATVSRAINGSENINPETKARILAFVDKKGYTPNVIARNLSKMENIMKILFFLLLITIFLFFF